MDITPETRWCKEIRTGLDSIEIEHLHSDGVYIAFFSDQRSIKTNFTAIQTIFGGLSPLRGVQFVSLCCNSHLPKNEVGQTPPGHLSEPDPASTALAHWHDTFC